MLSTNCNYWEPSIGLGPTPNDIGTLTGGAVNCVGWYVVNDGLLPFGGITKSLASLADFGSWTESNLVHTPGETDPITGNAAFALTESTDGGPTTHSIFYPGTNYIQSWSDLYLWHQATGRDQIRVVIASTGSAYSHLNGDGSKGSEFGVTAELVQSVGSWNQWKLPTRLIPSNTNIYIYTSIANSITYQGDGRDSCHVYLPQLVQPRLSLVSDLSPSGADIANATPGTQPLCYSGFALVNGLPAAYREFGRTSYLSVAHAAVVGAFSGNPATYAVTGVTAFGGSTAARLFHTSGPSSHYEVPLYDKAGTLFAYRGNASVSDKSYGVATSVLATAKTFSLVANSDRTIELYVNGTYQGSVTHDAIGAVTVTTANVFQAAGTTESETLAEMALLSGQIPGATAATRYIVLQPILQAMGRRWRGLPA